ncbi:MAG: type II toxin-antitoxin system VapC family toxin [Ornithinimicrobium sp.]|uniref:type II toxin-antitoxin system VapC family toxin n=1 Tax=Ornithinimicrobium sp. TaxID=1977084 RepID=UPI003D9B4BD3
MTSILASPRLLLDTNVVIWLLLGDRSAVSARAQDALQDASHELLLSAVSVWEIATKRSLGKLDIDPSWARELLRLDLVQLPVTAEHARRVESLPWHHRDPFDRLLVAQAEAEQCPLVTADARLVAYDVSIVW